MIIYEPIFKILRHFLRLLECKKDDTIIFVRVCLITMLYAKRWFPKHGVRKVADKLGMNTPETQSDNTSTYSNFSPTK